MMQRPQRQAGGLAAWLSGFACAVGLVFCLLWSASAGRYTRDARLNRAALAVVHECRMPARRIQVKTGKGVVSLPVRPRFDRETAVQLALELARLRRQAESVASGAAGREQIASVGIAGASVFVRERLARYLKTGETRALVVLHGLGWPWVGRDPRLPSARCFQASWPLPLRGMRVSERERLLTLAREAPGWPVVRQRLEKDFGLTAEQVFAIRCWLVREALEVAFDSLVGVKRATDALGKYADLAPAQTEAVLAMAGTLELLRAGPEAAEALRALSLDYPHLVEPIRQASLGERQPVSGGSQRAGQR